VFRILYCWRVSLETDSDDKITTNDRVSIIMYVSVNQKDDDEPAFTWYATEIKRKISFKYILPIIAKQTLMSHSAYNHISWQVPFPGKYIVSSFIEYSVPGIVSTHPNTVSGRNSSSDNVLNTATSNKPFSLFFDIVVVCPLWSPELIMFYGEIYINWSYMYNFYIWRKILYY